MKHTADNVWHGWINSEGDRKDEADFIDPHHTGLYEFKSAMQMAGATGGWLAMKISKERMQALPMVHQQCSHTQPEPMEANYLTCGFGVKLNGCPILNRLQSYFDKRMEHPYESKNVTPEEIDEAKAMTCIWHMLMGKKDGCYIDWNEGAVQDCSDRRFWDRVYSNLSEPMPEMDT